MPPLLVTLLSLLPTLVVLYPYFRKRGVSLPPGPPAYPFIGNLLTFPFSSQWKTFSNVVGTSDLVYYHGFGTSILVLNSLEANLDLLVRKGNIYSDRPYFVVACELLDLIKSVALLPVGHFWRLQRKFSRNAFKPQTVNQYANTISAYANDLAESLLHDPDAFVDHIRLASGRLLTNVIYGIEAQSIDDPYIVRNKQSMEIVRASLIPGSFLVDFFPVLNMLPTWTPFLSFRRQGLAARQLIARNVQEPFEQVKRDIVSGAARPSFTTNALTDSEALQGQETRENFELNIKWASASMFSAGQETISVVLLNLILAMVTHPDKLRKAQAELREVLGARSPVFKDREDLPYVHAVLKETIRWRPPLPLSIVRSSNCDDYYRGYFIPKNTIIIPNLCTANYPAEMFAPERFMGENPEMDPSSYMFGSGIRVCPGRVISEHAIFIVATHLLRLDITHSIDENGQKIPIDTTYPPGFLSFPTPFRCHFQLAEKIA